MNKNINFKNLTIAHRGIHNNKDIPENSILSFKLALKKNIPIELDIQLTKDNQLVVFHDETLERMTSKKDSIQNLTLKEIKKLFLLETTEKIPTLKEVLNLINGQVLLDIEIKKTKRINETCTALIKELKNYPENFIIKSFDPKIVHWFKINNPNYTRGLLVTHKANDKLYNFLSLSYLTLFYCQPDFLAISKKILTHKKIKKLKKKYPLLIWTIQNEIEYKKYYQKDNSYIWNNL